MVRRPLLAICSALLLIAMAGCGQSYKLVSISASPSTGYDFTELGETGALTITATYSNTKTENVTLSAQYEVQGSSSSEAPSGVVSVDSSGVIHNSSSVTACTWTSSTSNGTTTYTQAPYTILVTFTEWGVTKQTTVPVTVETKSNCSGS
jgi:hypothetical protein